MIKIINLGAIENDKSFSGKSTSHTVLIPVGYSIERSVFGFPETKASRMNVCFPSDPNYNQSHPLNIFFTASVSNVNGAPFYKVTRSDDEKKVYEGNNVNNVWKGAVEQLQIDFADKKEQLLIQSKGAGLGKRGLDFLGLGNKTIIDAVNALEGAAKLLETVVPLNGSTANPKASQGSDKAAKPKKEKTAKSTPSAKKSNKKDESSPTETRKRGPKKNIEVKAAAPPAPFLVCPDCGLASTPFCALTGKPHLTAPPCALCGLTSAFCPETGLPHEGVVQRADRGRGEVRLPSGKKSSTRRQKKKDLTPQTTDGEVQEIVVLNSQPTPLKRTRSKAGAKASTPRGSSQKSKRKKKDSGETASVADCEEDAPLKLISTVTLKEVVAPPKPEEPEVPQLRPQLSAKDTNKALLWMFKDKREQAEAILPPHVAALKVSYMHSRKGRPLHKAKPKGKKSTGKSDDADGEKAEGEIEETGNHDDESNPQSPSSAAGGELPNEVSFHPLAVASIKTSVSGKRYLKFMSMYTSERSKFNALSRIKTENKPKVSAPAAVESTEKEEETGAVSKVVSSEDAMATQVLHPPTENDKE